jgi:serine O-acetyltransferase
MTPLLDTQPCPPATTADAIPPPNRGDRNLNPQGIGLLALLREDLRTHDDNPFEQGFWAVAVHRFGNWRMGVRFRPLRAPLTLIYRFLFKWVEWTCGITLPYTTRLGRRVRIWHHGGMILSARSIGDDVHIRQNTTFGLARRGAPAGAIPTIGDRVDVGCGACVLGYVRVGDDSLVGANAVVLDDVPAGATAVGAPARVVARRDVDGVQGQGCAVEDLRRRTSGWLGSRPRDPGAPTPDRGLADETPATQGRTPGACDTEGEGVPG